MASTTSGGCPGSGGMVSSARPILLSILRERLGNFEAFCRAAIARRG
jgi:hypothetical protein